MLGLLLCDSLFFQGLGLANFLFFSYSFCQETSKISGFLLLSRPLRHTWKTHWGKSMMEKVGLFTYCGLGLTSPNFVVVVVLFSNPAFLCCLSAIIIWQLFLIFLSPSDASYAEVVGNGSLQNLWFGKLFISFIVHFPKKF